MKDRHKSIPNPNPMNTLVQKVYGGRGRGDLIAAAIN